MRKCGIVNTLSSRDRSITAVDTATQQTDTSLLAYLLCPAAATTTAALLMRRSQRLRSARRHAGRRCEGCKDAHCVRPVVTHWGVNVLAQGSTARTRCAGSALRWCAGRRMYGDQDGGEGQLGTVVELPPQLASKPEHRAGQWVAVQWRATNVLGTYRAGGAGHEGVFDIASDDSVAQRELRISLLPGAASLGVTVAGVAQQPMEMPEGSKYLPLPTTKTRRFQAQP